MIDPHLIALCQDYLEIVDLLDSGYGLSPDDVRRLDGNRQVAHNHLIDYTGFDHREDMVRYCRTVLHGARAQGHGGS